MMSSCCETNSQNSDRKLQLDVFMEPDKIYIRSTLNDFPIYEVEGSYSEERVKEMLQSIKEQKLDSKILDLFDGITEIKELQGIKCTIFDCRQNKTATRVCYLYNEVPENGIIYDAFSRTDAFLSMPPLHIPNHVLNY